MSKGGIVRGGMGGAARGGAKAGGNTQRQNRQGGNSYHQKKQAMGISNDDSDWHSLSDSLLLLPECSGVFKLGLGGGGAEGTEVVYISHTTEHRTLREMVTQVLHGWEGGTRLAMMVVNPHTRGHLMVKWTECVYPEELIEDEIEEYIIEHSCPPTYNTPVDDSKGIWVIVDDDDDDEDGDLWDNNRHLRCCCYGCSGRRKRQHKPPHPSNTVYPPR